jgi:hypothetical protein
MAMSPSDVAVRARLITVIAVLACASCSERPPDKVTVTSSRRVDFALRDGGRGHVRLFRMTRASWSKGGLLSGLEPPRVRHFEYLDLEGEVRTAAGGVVAIGWTSRDRRGLGRAADDPEVQLRPARIAVAASDVLLEVELVRGRPAAGSRGPVEEVGGPDARYLRLAGTRLRWPFRAPDEPEYAWRPATREEFERAAETGGATEVDDEPHGSGAGGRSVPR